MQEPEDISLVDKNEDLGSNDPILELKMGIYNLVVNLLNNYVVYVGPTQAVTEVTNYLDEISHNFKNSLEQKDEI